MNRKTKRNTKQRKNRTKRLSISTKPTVFRYVVSKSRKTKKIRGGYTIPGYADMTDMQKHRADADYHVENARRFMTKYGVSDNIQNAHIMGHLYANNMI